MFDTFQQKFNGFQSLKCKSFDTEFMTENHAIHSGLKYKKVRFGETALYNVVKLKNNRKK